MASEVPFPYITGLPEEAQRQIERNFLEVQKNLGSISHSWYYLAAHDASADEKARADYVFDGAADSSKMASIFATHPGGHFILSGGNFNLTVTLDTTGVAAIVGIGEPGGLTTDNTTINFNDNGVGGALTACDAGGALMLVDALYLANLDVQYNGALAVSAFLGNPTTNGGTVTAEHVGLGNMLTVIGTLGGGNFQTATLVGLDVSVSLSGGGHRFSTENFPAGHRLINFRNKSGSFALGQLTQCVVVNPVGVTWTEFGSNTNYIIDSRGAANTFRGNATGSTGQVLDISATAVPGLIGTDKNLLPAALDLPKGVQTYPAPASFPPSGSASGSLTGTYPAPTFAGRDSSVDAINKDLLPLWIGAEPLGMQTIPAPTGGGGSPTGAAGGSLAGSYPSPTFAGRDTSVDAINKDLLPAALLLDNGAFGITTFPAPAGGSLAGVYPNPTFAGRDNSVDAINKDMLPTWVGVEPLGMQTIPAPTGGGGSPTGAAGGSLAGSYPSPTFAGRDASVDAINKDLLPSALMPPMGVSFPAKYPHLAAGTAGTGLQIPQVTWDAEGRLVSVNNVAAAAGIDPTAWHNSDIGPMMTGDASGIQTYGGGTVGTTTQALLDFGASPVFEKSFTVTDASVVVGMRILCSIAMDTGTGRQPDELEMDDLYATASVVTNGVLQVNVASDGRKGPVIGKFNLNYIVPVTVTQSIPSHASTHGRGASDPLDLLFKDMTQQFMMMG